MRLDITEKEYFGLKDVIHSSQLVRLKNKGVDFINEKIEQTYDMFLGHTLEWKFHDHVFGSRQFEERCFVHDGTMPKILFEWLQTGEDLYELADEAGKSKYTKTGKLSAAKATVNLFAWIDACNEQPGKIPVSTDTLEMLEMQVESMLKIELHGCTLSDLTEQSEYQVAYKHDDLICLVDMLFIAGDVAIPFDFKHIPTFDRINSRMSDWWVQYCHYTYILRSIFAESFPALNVEGMRFITASKSMKDRYYAKMAIVDETQYMLDKYYNLVNDMRAWRNNNSNDELGYSESELYRPFIK